MNFFTSLLFVLFSVTLTLAQYDQQSAPFNLILVSNNQTLNSSALAACHTGAAIESLCVAGAVGISSDTFTFNTSSNSGGSPPPDGEPGYLAYLLQGSNFNDSEPLALYVNPASNVALPLFYPGVVANTQAVAFNADGLMNIQAYDDDRTAPPTLETKAYYRWYACVTYYLGYQYQNLAFVLGNANPQNPTCEKVDVRRVFV